MGHLREAIDRYSNLSRIAMDFAITCDSETEALCAYLNARWAARLGLALIDAQNRIASGYEQLVGGR